MDETGPDPGPARPSRLFWLWFAANASLLGLVVGCALFSLGMSLRQSVVAALLGAAVSAMPLGLGALAGSWNGLPTMVVSRATFGIVGNIVPVLLALLARFFWGALLLWLVAASTSRVLTISGLHAGLGEGTLTAVVLALGGATSAAAAVLRPAIIRGVLVTIGIASALLVAWFITMTLGSIDVATALAVADGPGILVVSGVVLVVSLTGAAWATGGADLVPRRSAVRSRVRPHRSGVLPLGTASMGWAALGTLVPTVVLLGYGALLAGSNHELAGALLSSPVDAIASLLPPWYPVPLVAGIVPSLLAGVVVNISSAGLAIESSRVGIGRRTATVVAALVITALAILLAFGITDIVLLVRDLATTLAVPIAAWAGLFSAEMMLRKRRFDARSLESQGGAYPDVNWLNVATLLVASFVGFGLTTAAIGWLSWQGYGYLLVGVPLDGDLASSDLGVLVALAIGLVTPIAAGSAALRAQEGRTDRSVD